MISWIKFWVLRTEEKEIEFKEYKRKINLKKTNRNLKDKKEKESKK